jgi:molecular chaperone DnaK (HSP70)
MSSPRTTVGIDLGTTNTVVAWADDAEPAPRLFEVPGLVSASEVEASPLFPSLLYAPAPGETVVDPWADAPWALGTFARRRGREVPGRLVQSAKSWLCHTGVDRRAAILPWGVTGDAPRLSPVEASERVLRHVARTWDAAHPSRPLADQSVVLTVPASFDESARELTVEAAERAGLRIRLLEEPQAAFYDFMSRGGDAGLERLLASREEAEVLVCDVGGGTTDLTLIRVFRADGKLELERVAVGRHLLLGGDNIDLTLAHLAEARLLEAPERLDPTRFAELVLSCRGAKERLLGADAPDHVTIALRGTGSALVGSSRSTRIEREEVERIVFDGFLPVVARDARPERARAGFVAFGLPYEHDPAITRHVANFFARHSQKPLPDALLLNGGLFRAERAASRLRDVVSKFGDGEVELLPLAEPDLAVARGAVAYGRSLFGQGRRIGGGSARGFYVAVDVGGERRALSIVPRGAKEGEHHRAGRGLTLRVGKPARFELYASDELETHAPGTVIALDDERLLPLPPVTTRFDVKDAGATPEIAVALEGELSAVGIVELSCIELEPPAERVPRRFRLAFDLRSGDRPSERPPESRARPESVPPEQRLAEAKLALDRCFGKGRAEVKAREIKDLLRELERLLGERRYWTLDTNRQLFDVLVPGQAARRRSEDHERVFWMLAGYCLRPGFGDAGDAMRVVRLSALFGEGVAFSAARTWQQFFIAFRRIAPGLDDAAQQSIRDLLDPFVIPSGARSKKSKTWKPQAPEELLELVSWLERATAERRAELGRALLERTWTSKDPRLWAAIGRIGARVPTYASVHHVVAGNVAERWLDHLLRERFGEVPTAARAAFELSRRTGDRARDVAESLRREVLVKLAAAKAPEEWLEAVREVIPVLPTERATAFGDELPVGLRLIDAESS